VLVGVSVLVAVGVEVILGVVGRASIYGPKPHKSTTTSTQKSHSAVLIMTSKPQDKSHVNIFLITQSLLSIILIMICGAELNKLGNKKIGSGESVDTEPNKKELFSKMSHT
jgi:hypothetical protein